MKPATRKVLWLVLFSIAMGFLETAVVVYLREIYYPQGFTFPLTTMDSSLVVVELLREASTVIMLVGIGILAGTTANQRLAFFLTAFAVWDLFYYVFLKLLLDWPASLLTWDILFLIPVPWIGPVLAPCLVCLTMLLLAAVLYLRDRQDSVTRLRMTEWVLILSGCLIIVGSWTSDYFSVTSGKSPVEALQILSTYVPQSYNWWLFAMGEALILAGIFRFWKRTGSQG